MRASIRLLGLLVVLCDGVLAAEEPQATSAAPASATKSAVDFERDVRPLFVQHCQQCHGPAKQRSGYRLDRRDDAIRGGDSGEAAIVPGKAKESRLVSMVSGEEAEAVMPPKGPRLDARQIETLRAWVDQGADWPAGTAMPDKTDVHWSLLPLSLPAVPQPKDAGWVRNPIDAFVRAKLDEKGLHPAPEAERRTWIRRATFDLTGLPPTPEEIAAFLDDASPQAFTKVIDRLLESPRYGERWARHWMDVIHFAETHGNDQDRPRPNAWPYRDYLIRSFNEDKPYARFIQEQLAGDRLYPNDPWATVALGFIAAGPWDESSQRDIRDDTVDKAIAQYLDRDDMVTTTMSAFTSTTVQCARCHNHKFDPISQQEYYSLQAVFAGVDRAERPYVLDPKAETLRQTLMERKVAFESRSKDKVGRYLDATARRELETAQAAWESAAKANSTVWQPLDPTTFRSSEGATPTKLADFSIRFDGKRPDVDTYTLVVQTQLKGITAFRLEVLADDTFPVRGPGRQENGNFHLTEFQVQASPVLQPASCRPVPLQKPVADYNQPGWTVAMAIDGDPASAWGIYPEVGKGHEAVFETKEPLGFDGGTTLTFVLEQKHGRGHTIGRPRLSATTSPRPSMTGALPPRVIQLLQIPAERRSPAEREELTAYYYSISPEISTLIEQAAKSLAALPQVSMVYAGTAQFKTEGSFHPAKDPRPVFVLRRGDIHNPTQQATPGALSCIPGLEPRLSLTDLGDEAGRRAALASWIADSRNVLTWRSIVNRVWHYHFGRGLADSPNDLGRMGSQPSHPELLDWLAVTFRDGGGSLKQLHRLILSSATYRQSCRHDADAARVDSENLYLWRMNRSRLDAESIRDAVLQISGKLDVTMGGPSVKQFVQSPGVHVTPVVDYLSFNVDSPESYRRSIYRFLFRTVPDPFMDSMDCPDASQLSPKRNASVTALQALAMLNDHFVVRQSEHLAARLAKAGADPRAQIETAFLLTLGRPCSPEEIQEMSAYARKHGMANVCRILLNCNEFIFLN